MKYLEKIYAVLLVVAAYSCTPEEQTPYYGGYCSVSESNSVFAGRLDLNNIKPSSYKLHVYTQDTLPDKKYFRFSITEYTDHGDYLANRGSVDLGCIKVNDTTILSDGLTGVRTISYQVEDCDALGCNWGNDSTGYIYVELLDSLNYFMDAQAFLFPDMEGCSDTRYGGDSIRVRIKGVFTRI